MNFAYYRKSKFNFEETEKRLSQAALDSGIQVLSKIELSQVKATAFTLCRKAWLETILKTDKNLIGLLPCTAVIMELDGKVVVGSGNPAVLGSVSQFPELHKLAHEAESVIKSLIDKITDAQQLKPSSVKLYSTMSCPYCSMEKSWLEKEGIKHEVIYVDKNQEAAQQMVEKTGQMGVPVTEIEYEDEDPVYVVGFDKVQLENLLK
jgi:glutaredoxin 3